MTFSIGTDPEFFVKETESGQLVSAIPHIPGTKEEPSPLPGGGVIQSDNVALEVATDPANSRDSFIAGIERILKDAVDKLPGGMEIVALASASFNPKELEDPAAQKFGCDPDYDAWEVTMNETPESAADSTFRSCGGHIHVGTNGEDDNTFLLDFEGKIDMVKAMDCIHGLISTILDSSEAAVDRRKLYGKVGAHRPKAYGVEYRVLSNFWLKSPTTVSLMYSLTQDALKVVRDGKTDDLIDAIGEDQVKSIIMNGDIPAAKKAVNDHIIKVLSEESLDYLEQSTEKLKTADLYQEWGLERKA